MGRGAGFALPLLLGWSVKTFAAIGLLMLCSCGFVPREVKQQETIKQTAALAATRNSELEQKIVSAPQPTIVTSSNPRTGEVQTTITPAPAVVTSKYHDGVEVEASESGKSWYLWAETIPLGVKLILLAIGIGMLLGIWFYIRKISAAAAASSELADHVLAEQIQRLRSKAMLSTEHEEVAHANVEIAALEAQRGKLAGGKK